MIARQLNGWLMRGCYGLRVLGQFPHQLREGPVVVLCNHVGSLDPLLLQAACPRPLRFMAAREYVSWWPARPSAESAGVIPVDRNGRDSAAVRLAMAALAGGDALGIFPEGKIAAAGSHELLPFMPGAVMLARRGKAQVVLAAIEGRHRSQRMVTPWLWPPPIGLVRSSVVAWDDGPCELPEGAGLAETAEYLRDKVVALRKRHGLP
jgi:1-acyl-sn-glycerol-3-phosphate acyltransferase